MLKLISALLSFFLCAQLAFAQAANTYAQSQFLSTYGNQGLVGCNGDPNQNYGLIFAPGTSTNNISTVTTAAASFNWSQVAPPAPNVAAFQLAVAQDPCIPVPALLQFCAYAGVINATTAQTLPVTQTLWAKAKAVDAQISGPFSGMCLDDPSTPTIDESLIPITTRLETISDLYNCQLNPAN